MWDPTAQEIWNFVENVPRGINPYPKLSMLLLQAISPPPTPEGTRIIRRICFGAALIIFLQCCYVLHLRVKLKSFRQFGFDGLGLFRIEFNCVMAVLFCGYTLLAMAFYILGEAVDRGFQVVSPWLMIFGCKFVVLTSSLTSHWWLCACHCASLKWKSRNNVTELGKKKIPRIVPWIMHSVIAFLLISPAFFVTYYYSEANAIYLLAARTLKPILKALKEEELSYSPKVDIRRRLLLTLAPGLGLVNVEGPFGHYVQKALSVYAYYDAFLCLTYIPLVSFTMRSLYQDVRAEVPFSKSVVLSSAEETRRLQEMSSITQRKRMLLAINIITVLLVTLAHVPSLVWMMVNSSNHFFRQGNWISVCFLSLHVPFSITGIFSCWLLIYSARKQLSSASDLPQGVSSRKFLASIFRKPDSSSSAPIQPSHCLKNACVVTENNFWYKGDELQQRLECEQPLRDITPQSLARGDFKPSSQGEDVPEDLQQTDRGQL